MCRKVYKLSVNVKETKLDNQVQETNKSMEN